MRVKDLFVTRSVSDLIDETEYGDERLRRSIGPVGLTAMGVGAIIGTGIFVVIGEGANSRAPACSSRSSSPRSPAGSRPSPTPSSRRVPVSGSAYTFS